jgi:hypothetical protein
MWSFETLLLANKRTEKPVVHISMNPDPKDRLDDGRATGIARDYLDRMGYGKQPFILYRHNDIERIHYHMVTVCVDENGVKINSGYEKRRSMAACRELEKKYDLHIPRGKQLRQEADVRKTDCRKGDLQRQLRHTAGALIDTYKIQGMTGFRTLLELHGCSMEEVHGRIGDEPVHGIFYSAIDENGKKSSRQLKSSLFGKKYGYESLQRKFLKDKKQTGQRDIDFIRRLIVQCMYRCRSRSREELRGLLKKRGIDMVLFTNSENRVYGITFIDHNTRSVINGSGLGKEFAAKSLSGFFDNPHFVIPFPDVNRGFEYSPAKEKNSREEHPSPSAASLFCPPGAADPDEQAWKRRKKKKNNDSDNLQLKF